MMQLSKEQVAALQRAWSDLARDDTGATIQLAATDLSHQLARPTPSDLDPSGSAAAGAGVLPMSRGAIPSGCSFQARSAST